jgi:hypothetical protein
MMPALQMIASSGPVFFTAATQARTDEGSASSHAAGAVSPSPRRMPPRPFPGSAPYRYRGSLEASTRMASYASPNCIRDEITFSLQIETRRDRLGACP